MNEFRMWRKVPNPIGVGSESYINWVRNLILHSEPSDPIGFGTLLYIPNPVIRNLMIRNLIVQNKYIITNIIYDEV